MSKDVVEEEWDAGIPIVIIMTLLALLGGGYAFYGSRVQLKEKEAEVELALEEVRAANNWAASKTDKAETKVYEVKEYSKLEPSVLGLDDENINANTPQFKFVGVNKDDEVPTVYESTISYTNHKGELNSVTQNVYVVYTDEINKPELRVKEVKKDGSKYGKDVAVNPTLYLPNNK